MITSDRTMQAHADLLRWQIKIDAYLTKAARLERTQPLEAQRLRDDAWFLLATVRAHDEKCAPQTKERNMVAESNDDEIEVTEEMIEAGFAVLKGSGIADEYSKADRYMVAAIFRAMFQQRKSRGERQIRNM